MKIILSRKGFDSAYGGNPSPILPNGRLISLPIPSNDDEKKYDDLKFDDKNTYFDVMSKLVPKIRYDKKSHELNKNTKCHLDPDIYSEIIKREEGWKACSRQPSPITLS